MTTTDKCKINDASQHNSTLVTGVEMLSVIFINGSNIGSIGFWTMNIKYFIFCFNLLFITRVKIEESKYSAKQNTKTAKCVLGFLDFWVCIFYACSWVRCRVIFLLFIHREYRIFVENDAEYAFRRYLLRCLTLELRFKSVTDSPRVCNMELDRSPVIWCSIIADK